MTCLLCLILLLFPLSDLRGGDENFSNNRDGRSLAEENSPFYSSPLGEASLDIWYEECMAALPLLSTGEQRIWRQKMEEDLLSWARKRFESSLPDDGLNSFENMIEEQSRNLLYQSEQDVILFDSAGDPLLRDPGLYPGDREQWGQELQIQKQELLARWEEGAEALIPEILLGIPADLSGDIRNEMDDGLRVSLGEYRSALRKETDRLILWSSASFDYLRQQDEYSLRNKSEDETAGALADRLIRETGFALSETEASLKEAVAGMKTASVDKASFHADSWEDSFRTEFQKGLDHWAEAEKELMASRLNWELRCEEKYLEAEELWDKALTSFSLERKAWISEISALLEEGQAAWEEKEDLYQKQIAGIVRETELAAAEEVSKFAVQVNSALELYRETSALLNSTEENVRFYDFKVETITEELDEYRRLLAVFGADRQSFAAELQESREELERQKYYMERWYIPNTDRPNYYYSIRYLEKHIPFLETTLALIEKEWEKYRAKAAPLEELLPTYRAELVTWEGLQSSLESQLEGAESMLFSLEETARGYDGTVSRTSLEQEIDFREEETQRLYRQWRISEAVTAYARMETVFRSTEAQSREEFNRSEAALGDAEEQYEAALSALSRLRMNLVDSQSSLTGRLQELEDAQILMREARDAYEASFSVYQSRNPDVLKQLLEDLEEEITLWYGNEEIPSERDELYALYFQAGEAERRFLLESESLALIRDLKDEELEGESDDYPGLERLEADGSDTEQILFTQRTLEILESGFLPELSPEELDAAIEAAVDQDSLESARAEREAFLTAAPYLNLLDASSLTEALLLGESTGEGVLDKMENFEDLDSLLGWYQPLLEMDYIPEYLKEVMDRKIQELWGDEPEQDSLYDAAFTQDLMNEAVSVLLNPADSSAALSSSAEYLARIRCGDVAIQNTVERAAEVEEDFRLSREDAEEYRQSVVDADFRNYETLKAVYDKALGLYKWALQDFDNYQQEYLEGQAELDRVADLRREAELEYQQAREILDFASTGYNSQEAGVFTILDTRRRDYEDSLAALNILQEIQAGGNTAALIDGEWAVCQDEARSLLSLSNHLEYTASALDQKMAELDREYGSALGDICDGAQNFADFSAKGLSFVFDEEMMNQEMTEFSTWKNGSLKTLCDQYFSSDEAEEVFSRDLMLWMRDMGAKRNAGELLKTFSYAYYHELASLQGMSLDEINRRYTIDLFNNSQHSDLLKQSGDMFNGVNIGYKADLSRYLSGGYTDVRKVLYNSRTGEPYRVYIGPEEWLRDQTAASFYSVKGNGSLNELYSFYKVLMFSSCIKNDLLARAMEEDLSAMAWQYIDDEAYHEQRKFKIPIFGGYRKTGRDIRDKREAIAKTADHYSGHYDRWNFAEEFIDLNSGYLNLDRCISQKAELTGGRDLNLDDLKSLMQSLTGSSPDEDQCFLLEELIQTIPLPERRDSSALIQHMTETLMPVRQELDERLLVLESRLSTERASLSGGLNSFLNKGDLDGYEAAAGQLYEQPVYLSGDYRDSALESIRAADCFSENSSIYSMEAYGNLLLRSFQSRLDEVKARHYGDLQSELEKVRGNKSYWEERVNGLITEGLAQWDSSAQRLIAHRESWRGEFEREYEDKALLWELKHNQLTDNRESWLEESSGSALETGTESMARQMGLDADSLISEVSFSFIPDISREAGSMQSMLDNALDGRTMDDLLTAVNGLNSSIRGSKLLLSGSLPLIPVNTSTLHNLSQQQDELKEEICKALSSAQALSMKEAAMEMERDMMNYIDEANISVDVSVESQLSDEGYARRGDRFDRTVIIDSSLLGGNETERQVIDAYNYYEAPNLDLGVDLSLNHLKTLSSDMIQASINLATERLQNYLILIFGGDKDSPALRAETDRDFITYLEEQEKAFAASGKNNSNKENSRGLFNFHLGYAPVMSDKDPEKVKTEGYGEFGRIFKDLAIQQARLMRGLAGMNVPWYSQKLWDDDADNDGDSDGFMGAPNVRTVVDIAVSVAGSAFMGPFPALMVSMLDDAVFALADMGNGVLNASEAGFGLVKKAGSSLLTYGAGEAAGALDTWSSFNGAGEVFSDIGYKGLEISAASYGSAAVNAFDGDGFHWNSFNNATSWDSLSTSYLSGLTGQAVSSTLELGTFGFTGDVYKDASAFSNLAGGLSGSAVEYAMTGSTKLNVLNIAGTGVLELNLGGRESLLAPGMEGTDISAGTLLSAGRGLQDYSRNIQINRAVSDKDLRAGMRTLYSGEEGSEPKNLYDEIISGRTSVKTGTNQSYEGYTTVDGLGGRVIDLNKTGKSSLDLAVLMSHEAYRDGLDNGTAGQASETARAVMEHMQTANELQELYGSGYLNERNNAEVQLLNRYLNGEFLGHLLSEYTMQNYDMSGEFWKLTNDGFLVWDGRKDLVNEEGEIIRIDKTGSYSLSLMNWLGRENSLTLLESRGVDTDNMSDTEIAYALMKSSGSEWNSTAYSATTGVYSGAYVPRTVTGGQSANSSGLEDRLQFQLTEDEAFHKGKISQESPDIAYWVEDADGNRINGMAATGCYYLSTLGAVQTQAGKLLTTEQINRITEAALEEGWLKVNENSIYPTGSESRTDISQLAFAELGEYGYLDFSEELNVVDGSIIVGKTINDNYHAREGNGVMDIEVFDPYENISYQSGQDVILKKSKPYEYYDYQKYYWKQFEEYYF